MTPVGLPDGVRLTISDQADALVVEAVRGAVTFQRRSGQEPFLTLVFPRDWNRVLEGVNLIVTRSSPR